MKPEVALVKDIHSLAFAPRAPTDKTTQYHKTYISDTFLCLDCVDTLNVLPVGSEHIGNGDFAKLGDLGGGVEHQTRVGIFAINLAGELKTTLFR
jgi:hypothetical protein